MLRRRPPHLENRVEAVYSEYHSVEEPQFYRRNQETSDFLRWDDWGDETEKGSKGSKSKHTKSSKSSKSSKGSKSTKSDDGIHKPSPEDCTPMVPQKVSDVCCKIAMAGMDDTGSRGASIYEPHCKGDLPVCCKCHTSNGSKSFICIAKDAKCDESACPEGPLPTTTQDPSTDTTTTDTSTTATQDPTTVTTDYVRCDCRYNTDRYTNDDARSDY